MGRSTNLQTYGDARVGIGKIACMAGHSLQTSIVKNNNLFVEGIEIIIVVTQPGPEMS